MPRGVKKENLPSKICIVCDRPYTWRKKWERSWDEITTCSKSCNQRRRAGGCSVVVGRDKCDDDDDDDNDDGGGGGGGPIFPCNLDAEPIFAKRSYLY